MKIDTPCNIEILLHCYCCPTRHPRHDAPSVAEAYQMYVDAGCIERHGVDGDVYRTTDKGNAWVLALCNVRMPVRAWLDAETKEVLAED